MSQVSGLELKKKNADCISKWLGILPKNHGSGISARAWDKAASSAT